MSPTDRFVPTRASLVVLVAIVALAGCARSGAPRRVVERAETLGKTHVRFRSELHPARATLGDRVTWRLTASIEAGTGAKPETLLLDASPPSMELEAMRPPTERSGPQGLVWSRELLLRGFDLGPIELPAAALPVSAAGKTDTLEFPRDTLFVDSLTQATNGALRPDRGPITPPLRPLDYAVLAIAALVAIAAVVLLIRWIRGRGKRKARETRAPAPEPPETRFLEALEELEGELGKVTRDVFYDRLSQALRVYVQSVTGIPAPDLTTTELERELQRDARVRAEGREAVLTTLRRSDLAKFGRFEDAESEAKSILRQARSVSARLL
ncbi:MAG TPA: hypothetical protein VET83_06325 [Candidatus Dormibacteraeota bacterium]|nr:hypothetical protein [Candidatus Dormibacteraeota bacterium]